MGAERGALSTKPGVGEGGPPLPPWGRERCRCPNCSRRRPRLTWCPHRPTPPRDKAALPQRPPRPADRADPYVRAETLRYREASFSHGRTQAGRGELRAGAGTGAAPRPRARPGPAAPLPPRTSRAEREPSPSPGARMGPDPGSVLLALQ